MRSPLRNIVNISACKHAITEFIFTEVRFDSTIQYWSSLMSEYYTGHHSRQDIILRGLTFLILVNAAAIISFKVKRDNGIRINFFEPDVDVDKWKKIEKYTDQYKNNRNIIRQVILFFVFFFMRDVPSCS